MIARILARWRQWRACRVCDAQMRAALDRYATENPVSERP